MQKLQKKCIMHHRHVNNSGGGLAGLVGRRRGESRLLEEDPPACGDAGYIVLRGELSRMSSISAAGVARHGVVPEDVLSGSTTAAFQLCRERQAKTEPSESLKLFRCERGTAIVLQRKVCHPGAPMSARAKVAQQFKAVRSFTVEGFRQRLCPSFLRRLVLQCRVTNDILQMSRGPHVLQWSMQLRGQRAETSTAERRTGSKRESCRKASGAAQVRKDATAACEWMLLVRFFCIVGLLLCSLRFFSALQSFADCLVRQTFNFYSPPIDG